MGKRKNARRRAEIKRRLMAVEHDCWLCLLPLDFTISDFRNPWAVEVDEELPVSRGGDCLDISNCHLVHRVCNLIKGNRILERGALAGVVRARMKPKPSRRWQGRS